MSTFQQFFPAGGGSSSGGGSNVGGGTTPVEIIAVSGGGGAGGTFCFVTNTPDNTYCASWSNNPQQTSWGACMHGGCGGSGAVLCADNYFINPGTTYPITIGTGGSAGTDSGAEMTKAAFIHYPGWPGLTSPTRSGGPVLAPDNCPGAGQGSNGGATSFNNPCCPLSVDGGGGGGGARHPVMTAAPNLTDVNGLPGGTGGSGAGLSFGPGTNATKSGYVPINCCTVVTSISGVGGCGKYYTRLSSPDGLANAERMTKPFGWIGGFPASACPSSTINNSFALGGGSMGNISVDGSVPAPQYCSAITVNNFDANWVDSARFEFGRYPLVDPGNQAGAGGGSGTNGSTHCSANPGVLLIRWPDQSAAATSFPGGVDLSSQTPGYHTYCFTTSGSITL